MSDCPSGCSLEGKVNEFLSRIRLLVLDTDTFGHGSGVDLNEVFSAIINEVLSGPLCLDNILNIVYQHLSNACPDESDPNRCQNDLATIFGQVPQVLRALGVTCDSNQPLEWVQIEIQFDVAFQVRDYYSPEALAFLEAIRQTLTMMRMPANNIEEVMARIVELLDEDLRSYPGFLNTEELFQKLNSIGILEFGGLFNFEDVIEIMLAQIFVQAWNPELEQGIIDDIQQNLESEGMPDALDINGHFLPLNPYKRVFYGYCDRLVERQRLLSDLRSEVESNLGSSTSNGGSGADILVFLESMLGISVDTLKDTAISTVTQTTILPSALALSLILEDTVSAARNKIDTAKQLIAKALTVAYNITQLGTNFRQALNQDPVTAVRGAIAGILAGGSGLTLLVDIAAILTCAEEGLDDSLCDASLNWRSSLGDDQGEAFEAGFRIGEFASGIGSLAASIKIAHGASAGLHSTSAGGGVVPTIRASGYANEAAMGGRLVVQGAVVREAASARVIGLHNIGAYFFSGGNGDEDWPEDSPGYALEQEIWDGGDNIRISGVRTDEVEQWHVISINGGTPMVSEDPMLGFKGTRYQATIQSYANRERIEISANYDYATGTWGLIKRASGR